MYSEFFRDMFSTPSSDQEEGRSDDRPLRLPNDLCHTAEASTTLCRFICPKKLGELRTVQIQDLDTWEPVLDATLALQMTDIRVHIITKFKNNKAGIPSEAVRLLTWAMRPEIECEQLKLDCIRALAYRRRSISPTEAIALGAKATSELMYIREKVRTLLCARTAPVSIPSIHCASRSDCEGKIFRAITENMRMDWMSSSDQGELDIFQIDDISICQSCAPNKNHLAGSLKRTSGTLDHELRRCAKVAIVGLYAGDSHVPPGSTPSNSV